jgi:predicted Zn-dependent protease
MLFFMKPISLLTALFLAFAAALASLLPGGSAHAAGRSLIRDAEIENTIRGYASPLFEAAGLVPEDVDIYIVSDNTLNAFVAGGQNLFIHTGLIMGADNASQIIGVIAHEAGHIAGGHLARSRDARENAQIKSIIGTVIGGAVGLATGRGDVGAAIIQGGGLAGLQGYLRFSRTQEAAADNAALTYLDQVGYSAEGLLQFMDKLGDQELLYANRQSPYLRTHPMSRDRYRTVLAHVRRSPVTDKPLPTRLNAQFLRMKAKLSGFLEPFGRVMRRYPESDTRLAARYARAIAYYRKPDMAQALHRLDALIDEHPNDPYFHELKAQALYENGHVREALNSYHAAVRLLPTSGLLRRELASAQIEAGDDSLLPAAVDNLTMTVQQSPNDTFAWRQLAIAQGRLGHSAQSSLALAEEAVRSGHKRAALYHAGKAQNELPRGSMGWLQAQDIIEAANVLDAGK